MRSAHGRRPPRPWTELEDRLVLSKAAPDKMIAELLDRELFSIYNRRYRLKIGREEFNRRSREWQRRWRRETGSPSHADRTWRLKPWMEWEDQLVMARIVPDAELAKRLGRSAHAVHVRRTKLRQRPDREAR